MKNSICLLLAIALTACASNTATKNGASQWDFDHQVQFKQTDLKAGKHHLQVIAKQDTEFSKLATFLMRRALRICKSYGFKIEVLEGVERFDDKLSFPNMIMPSLSANIECPKL
jgi:threonyl-tRNA synthetase